MKTVRACLLLIGILFLFAGCSTEHQGGEMAASSRPWIVVSTNPPLAAGYSGSGASLTHEQSGSALFLKPEEAAARAELENAGLATNLLQKMFQGQPLALAEIEELANKKVSDETILKYLTST